MGIDIDMGRHGETSVRYGMIDNMKIDTNQLLVIDTE
jgi:hypothetical protein